MIRAFVITLVTAAAVTLVPFAGEAQAAKQEVKPNVQAFLKTVAGKQEGRVALGQLAAQQGKNPRVKQYGEEMVVIHRIVGSELRQLAAQEAFNSLRNQTTIISGYGRNSPNSRSMRLTARTCNRCWETIRTT